MYKKIQLSGNEKGISKKAFEIYSNSSGEFFTFWIEAETEKFFYGNDKKSLCEIGNVSDLNVYLLSYDE